MGKCQPFDDGKSNEMAVTRHPKEPTLLPTRRAPILPCVRGECPNTSVTDYSWLMDINDPVARIGYAGLIQANIENVLMTGLRMNNHDWIAFCQSEQTELKATLKKKVLPISLIALLSALCIALCTEPTEAADLNKTEILSVRNIRPKDDASRKVLSDNAMKQAVPLPTPHLTPEDMERLGFDKFQRKGLPPDRNPAERPFDPTDFLLPRPVENPATRRPFWNVGKLFFITNSGEKAHCTAEFVGSRRVLLTAGHCVADMETGEPFSNFTFAQAYDTGSYTKKIGIECVAIYDEFFELGGAIPFDYAFLYTDEESASGNLGFRKGTPFADVAAVGYPKNFDDAERMYLDKGTTRLYTSIPGIAIMLGNEMRHGSSGGAWIGVLRERPGGKSNMVVGLNARIGFYPSERAGPLFDQNTKELLQHVKDGGCRP